MKTETYHVYYSQFVNGTEYSGKMIPFTAKSAKDAEDQFNKNMKNNSSIGVEYKVKETIKAS